MLELYGAPQSTCSQKVRLTLAEKNLNFVEHKMKLFQNDQLKPEYLKLNPNGVVPTLVDDGTPIIDLSVIMEYLDEVYPEIALSPAEPKQRAHMRAWLRFLKRSRLSPYASHPTMLPLRVISEKCLTKSSRHWLSLSHFATSSSARWTSRRGSALKSLSKPKTA